jgi:hypothetical protein
MPEAVPEAADGKEALSPFPLGLLLTRSQQKRGLWQPDWDEAMPPDGFALASGRANSIVLSMEDQTYQARWNSDGSIREFPFWLENQFVQVRFEHRPSGTPEKLLVTSPNGEYTVDFIDDKARITAGAGVYFVGIRQNDFGVAETWYDSAGGALADFLTRTGYADREPRPVSLVRRSLEEQPGEVFYQYDSFGNVSAVDAETKVCSALYAEEGRPRYWDRGEEHRTLQWDERGFLMKIFGSPAPEIRYEYTFDARGNWTERREIRMIPRLGMLVPEAGRTVKRVITYREEG